MEAVSLLDASIDAVWAAMLRTATFRFVTRGLLGARRLLAGADKLEPGQRASGWIFLFHVVPLHRHTIEVVDVDRATFTVRTREHGGVLRRWEHVLQAEAGAGEGRDAPVTRYRDVVTFEAGRFTALLVPLVSVFFRYRHRRWRRLARRLTW